MTNIPLNNSYFIYRLDHPNSSPMMASIIFPSPGEPMSTEFLVSELNSILDSINVSIEHKVEEADKDFNGIGSRSTKEPDAATLAVLYSFFKSKEIPDEAKRNVLDENYQFFVNAYASMECKELKYPVFKNVLLITDEEFLKLKEVLGKLTVTEGSDYDQRQRLQDAFKKILETYMGQKEIQYAMNTMSTDQILELATGLKSSNSTFSNITANDIMKKEKLNRDELHKMIYHLNSRAEKFYELKGNENYIFKQFRTEYYWIPEDYLP